MVTNYFFVLSYTCRDAGKEIVHLTDSNIPVSINLTSTCLFNGEYDKVMEDYGCTECPRPADPPFGKFKCESSLFERGSECHLMCDPGYIPKDQIRTTCVKDKLTDNDVWNYNIATEFECVRAVNLILGGIDQNKK